MTVPDHSSPVSGATPAAPQPSKPILLGVLSLVLGIIGFLTGLLPFVGIVIGASAVALGVLSLVKRQAKGFAITGIILGAIGLVVSILMTVLLAVGASTLTNLTSGNSQPSATVSPEPAPLEVTPEDLAEFSEVDSSTIAAILEDPAAHAGEMLIVHGTSAEALVHDGLDSEGLCVMAFTVSAISAESADDASSSNAVAVGEGTMYECDMLDRFITTDSAQLAEQQKMYVVVSGETLEVANAEKLPMFIFVHAGE